MLKILFGFALGALLFFGVETAQAHNGDQLHGVLSCLASPSTYARLHCESHFKAWADSVTFRN